MIQTAGRNRSYPRSPSRTIGRRTGNAGARARGHDATAFVLTLLIGLALPGAGCTLFVAKETRYLESAQGRATQDDVQKEFGAPRLKARTPEGDPIWVYEVRSVEAGSQDSWSSFGSWCDEYVLTFDRQGILRRWTQKSEKHGGERMPAYCVTGGFTPGS